MWLTAKCYLVQKEVNEDNKYNWKGVSKKHNDLNFQRNKNVLDIFLKTRREVLLEGEDIDKAKNVGFRVYDKGVVTYKQDKLGLSTVQLPLKIFFWRLLLNTLFFGDCF